MRILILGGDGYLGWPQSLYLSSKGHDITIFDNLMRRHFDLERGFDSLMPIYTLHERVAAWKEVSGRQMQLCIGDTTDYEAVAAVFRDFQPEAVVHFAEQRSAPYSMIDRKHAVFTQTNNVVGTLNVLYAMKEFAPDCHLVKLGTMGEYGTQTSISRKALSRFITKAGAMCCLSRNSQDHSITLVRLMIATTLCFVARSGDCALLI